MLILLSPSKTQDFKSPSTVDDYTQPAFLSESQILIRELKGLSQKQLASLMGVSTRITALNHQRYRDFKTPFTLKNAKQAMFAFRGDVYDGLQADTFSPEGIEFAQKHLRIISGLYGILRPLDLIQPYRLEMKTKLRNPRGHDLYDFWGDRLTSLLNDQLANMEQKVIVNLASEEYFKAINASKLKARVITPQFKEKKAAGYQMIGLLAKKARGRMAHYIMANSVDLAEALQFFSEDGYRFNVGLSKPDAPVYTREKRAPVKTASSRV